MTWRILRRIFLYFVVGYLTYLLHWLCTSYLSQNDNVAFCGLSWMLRRKLHRPWCAVRVPSCFCNLSWPANSFTYPNKQKLHVIKSGERVALSRRPPRPIQRVLQHRFKCWLAYAELLNENKMMWKATVFISKPASRKTSSKALSIEMKKQSSLKHPWRRAGPINWSLIRWKLLAAY